MDVPVNPASVMEFYWRNPGGENVSFFLLLRSPPVVTFPNLLLLPETFIFFSSVMPATQVRLWLKSARQTQRHDRRVIQNRPDQ
jgi:hypothetical protein